MHCQATWTWYQSHITLFKDHVGCVSGEIRRIREPQFDFIDKPTRELSIGAGFGATTSPIVKMSSFFRASQSSTTFIRLVSTSESLAMHIGLFVLQDVPDKAREHGRFTSTGEDWHKCYDNKARDLLADWHWQKCILLLTLHICTVKKLYTTIVVFLKYRSAKFQRFADVHHHQKADAGGSTRQAETLTSSWLLRLGSTNSFYHFRVLGVPKAIERVTSIITLFIPWSAGSSSPLSDCRCHFILSSSPMRSLLPEPLKPNFPSSNNTDSSY